MSDRLEDDLMEDLMAEPEARSHSADEFDEESDFDDLDDPLDDPGDFFDSGDPGDEFEEVVTDALEAEDADEFWGKIGGFLKKVGRGVGKVARVVAPIASAIPIPQAQLIGRVAGAVGKVLADEGDEMDALDELADYADDEDAVDAMAPAIAGLAIRSAMKNVAALPRPHRRQLVQAVTAATRHVTRAHGPRAVAAVPGIVHQARRVAARHGLPAHRLPHLVKRTAAAAVRSPRVTRKLVRASNAIRSTPHAVGRHQGRRHHRGIGTSGSYEGGMSGGAPVTSRHGRSCPSCGRGRTSWQLRGPVRLTIEAV